MDHIDIHRRNEITGKGIKYFIIGLFFTSFLSLAAFFALLFNVGQFYSSEDAGDIYGIIFRLLSISITIFILAIIAMIFFIRGLGRFHETKKMYPDTSREKHVNWATFCFVILIILMLAATTWGVISGLPFIENFKGREIFEIWVIGTGIFIPGTILFGLFFTLIIIVLDKSKLLVFAGFSILVVGGVFYIFFPPIFAIMAFVGNVFFLITYFHIKSGIRHSLADRSSGSRGKKDLGARMYRKTSPRVGAEEDFDTAANPYTSRAHRGGSAADIRKIFEEKEGDGPKRIVKKIPKDLRYENCPMCGEKLPPYATLTKCPACKEDIFD